MRPTFLGFETQKRTLQIAQKNLDITGNNISNINTPGYTRQRVDMYSMYVSGNSELLWSSKTNQLSLNGQGVNAYGVSQIRDIYIDKRYRENVAIESETEKKVQILTDIEDVLDNFESDGLQFYTQQFFNALQDYSVEKPDSADVAKIATNAAVNLCRLLNDYDTQLTQIEYTYVNEFKDSIDYVNKLMDEMNVLNKRIANEKFHYPEEYGPNELYDEMNLYIDELATYGNIEFSQNTDGTYNVKMANVEILNGEHNKTNHLIMKDYDVYGQAIIFFESGQDINLTSGSLKGYYDMINGNGVYATGHQNNTHGIAYFKSAIDEFARTLANTFNTANGANDDESRMMFTSYLDGALITAGNIHVAQGWQDDPTMIGQTRSFDPITGMYHYGYDENALKSITVNKLDLDQIKNDGNAYAFNADVNGEIKTIKFNSGSTNAATMANIKKALEDAYGNDLVFSISESGDAKGSIRASGNLVKLHNSAEANTANLNIITKNMYESGDDSGLVNLQNTNVLYLISQFDNEALKFGNSHDFEGSVYEYISFISNRLGQTIQYETSRNETAITTVDGLLDARDDVSAPQMDEEGINMLNYQKWYNASSRIVTALDDLLDKLINGTGRVGL